MYWQKATTVDNTQIAMTDAAFANKEEFKLQIGYFCIYNGKMISAKTTTPSLTCLSFTEADLCAINLSFPRLQALKKFVRIIDNKILNAGILSDSQMQLSIH